MNATSSAGIYISITSKLPSTKDPLPLHSTPQTNATSSARFYSSNTPRHTHHPNDALHDATNATSSARIYTSNPPSPPKPASAKDPLPLHSTRKRTQHPTSSAKIYISNTPRHATPTTLPISPHHATNATYPHKYPPLPTPTNLAPTRRTSLQNPPVLLYHLPPRSKSTPQTSHPPPPAPQKPSTKRKRRSMGRALCRTQLSKNETLGLKEHYVRTLIQEAMDIFDRFPQLATTMVRETHPHPFYTQSSLSRTPISSALMSKSALRSLRL